MDNIAKKYVKLSVIEKNKLGDNMETAKYGNAQAWVVTLTASLFFFYVFIQLNLFNAIDIALMEDFKINAVQLGQLASMYFYANALGLLPAGALLDRYSTKKLLLLAAAITTLGTLAFGLSTTYTYAAISRFMVGLGSSFCFLSCMRLASRWFPPSQMATITGVVVVMAMLGGLVVQTPFAILTQYIGWRDAMLFNFALGVVIFLIVAVIVKDRPAGTHDKARAEVESLKGLGLWRAMKLAMLNPQNWLGGLYTALLNSPVFLLGALWGIHYLMEVRNLTIVQASYATTMLFVGVILGSPFFGWLSDKIMRRVMPMTVGAVASLLVVLVLIYTPTLSLTSIITLFFLIGFVTSSQVLSYPTIAELNPSYLTSTAVSIDSMCVMMSGFILQPLFGWIMDFTNQSQTHVAVYSAKSFTDAMMIMPIAFVLGLILTYFMQETFCKSQCE